MNRTKRKDPLNVLIIQPWIRQGGAELISVYLANELVEAGHTAPIACTFVDLAGMLDQARVVQYLIPPRWLSRLCQRSRLIFLLLGPWLLLALVWRHSKDIDVLNPHNFPASWVAVVVGALSRIPVVWTCNEAPERLPWGDALKVGLADFLGWLAASSWLDRFLVKRVAAIYVPSEKTKTQVRERYDRDAAVIHLGVDVQFFEKGDGVRVRERLGISDRFVLLTVGKLHPQKNQIVCLRALRELAGEIPEAVLLLVGDGPMLDEWRDLAVTWGLGDQVRFLGNQTNRATRDLYGACDLNLFSPINQSWGFTPFEALCAQRISVLSSDCGAAEVIGGQRVGVVSEPTSTAFAKNILRVYEHPAFYQEMAARGRDYVARSLTWGAYTENVLALLGAAERGAS